MKKYLSVMLFICASLLITGCDSGNTSNQIKFATSAEYPPFEYLVNGQMTGFDIDLGHLIAKELGKEAVFENMQFSTILAALQSGNVDAGLATITITEERKKNFDFSDAYYHESMAMVFHQASPITDKSHIPGKKIACQLGSTMEIWLKKYYPNAEIITFDNNNLTIEALKAGHVDGVLIDGVQGSIYSQKNAGLAYSIIERSDAGYGLAFPKGSALKDPINKAIETLKANGELQKLQQKWLEG